VDRGCAERAVGIKDGTQMRQGLVSRWAAIHAPATTVSDLRLPQLDTSRQSRCWSLKVCTLGRGVGGRSVVNFSWVRTYVPSIEYRRTRTERVKGGFGERAKGVCVCVRVQKCEWVSEWRWLIKGRMKSSQAILVDKLLFDKRERKWKRPMMCPSYNTVQHSTVCTDIVIRGSFASLQTY